MPMEKIVQENMISVIIIFLRLFLSFMCAFLSLRHQITFSLQMGNRGKTSVKYCEGGKDLGFPGTGK